MKTFCSAMSKKSLDGDMIVLTDLLESEMSIQGKLIMADLVNGRVIVDTGDR
jgi:predicted RNA-binding protein